MELSSIDVPSTWIPLNIDSDMFMVRTEVLKKYSCVRCLNDVVALYKGLHVKLLGLQKLAKELGGEFVSQITVDGIPLLSKKNLRDLHNSSIISYPT